MNKLINRIFGRFRKNNIPSNINLITFDEYQKFAISTADPCAENPLYLAVGLCEEAGEAAGKVKKTIRDHLGVFDLERRNAIAGELGDALWYLANQAHLMGFTLSEIAAINVGKINGRISRQTLHGEGDNR